MSEDSPLATTSFTPAGCLIRCLERVDSMVEKVTGGSLVWEILIKVSVPIVLGLGGMMLAHEIRLSKIEATRFTAKDGIELRDTITKQLPPEWLKEKVNKLERGQREIELKLERLMTKMEEDK